MYQGLYRIYNPVFPPIFVSFLECSSNGWGAVVRTFFFHVLRTECCIFFFPYPCMSTEQHTSRAVTEAPEEPDTNVVIEGLYCLLDRFLADVIIRVPFDDFSLETGVLRPVNQASMSIFTTRWRVMT